MLCNFHERPVRGRFRVLADNDEATMAGDWIKVRMDLHDDPAVIAIATALDITEDEAVGKLVRFWCWANRHTTDGNADSVTEKWLDRYLGVNGLAREMAKQGWLAIKAQGGISVPKFDKHNGQSAKRRATTALRVAEHKKRTRPKGNETVTQQPLPNAYLEKRREEKIDTTPQSPPRGRKMAHSDDPRFAAFWRAYPRRVKRTAAQRAWAKLAVDDALLERILKAIEAYKATADWKKEEGRFIPHPASWLNGHQWEDEIGPVAIPAQPAINLAEYEAKRRAQAEADAAYLRSKEANKQLREANGGSLFARNASQFQTTQSTSKPVGEPLEANSDDF